jgi:hypothetical protein
MPNLLRFRGAFTKRTNVLKKDASLHMLTKRILTKGISIVRDFLSVMSYTVFFILRTGNTN